MKPSDLFFKLMEAAQEKGIERGEGHFYERDREGNVSVCAVGLGFWAVKQGLIA